MCIRDAIPRQWHLLLKNNILLTIYPHDETFFVKINNTSKPLKLVKSKFLYWYLNEKKLDKTKLHKKMEKYSLSFSDLQLKKIFLLNKNLTLETKLIEFQYRILHRVYASDSYVANFV